MSQLLTYCSDTIGAKGNSGDMVIKFIDESIDAAKYLTKIRYGLNDYRQLEIDTDRNIEITFVRSVENKVTEMLHEASRSNNRTKCR